VANWRPHLHLLVTDGGFRPDGTFVRWHSGANIGRQQLGGRNYGWHIEAEWQPNPQVLLTVGPDFYANRAPLQYVTSRADTSAAATFGRRYLFAEIDQRTLDLTTRLNVTLTPTLSLQLYTQPFVGTGEYLTSKELARPRPAVTIGNPNFSSRALRGNAVVRWEYRPGSTLYFVWTTACSAFSSDAAYDGIGDVGRLCQGRSDNVFAVKVNYWMSLQPGAGREPGASASGSRPRAYV